MLGNLIEEVDGDDEDDSGDADDVPCLRQTEEHASFLYLFLKSAVARADSLKKHSCHFLMSHYVTVHLEAYAVLTYVNRSVFSLFSTQHALC
jgi:hypothetical protein